MGELILFIHKFSSLCFLVCESTRSNARNVLSVFADSLSDNLNCAACDFTSVSHLYEVLVTSYKYEIPSAFSAGTDLDKMRAVALFHCKSLYPIEILQSLNLNTKTFYLPTAYKYSWFFLFPIYLLILHIHIKPSQIFCGFNELQDLRCPCFGIWLRSHEYASILYSGFNIFWGDFEAAFIGVLRVLWRLWR